jgi:hypothetical protein
MFTISTSRCIRICSLTCSLIPQIDMCSPSTMTNFSIYLIMSILMCVNSLCHNWNVTPPLSTIVKDLVLDVLICVSSRTTLSCNFQNFLSMLLASRKDPLPQFAMLLVIDINHVSINCFC